jgi:hypothetical protein
MFPFLFPFLCFFELSFHLHGGRPLPRPGLDDDDGDAAGGDGDATVMRLELTVEPSWLQAKDIISHSQRGCDNRKRVNSNHCGSGPAKRRSPPRLKRHYNS